MLTQYAAVQVLCLSASYYCAKLPRVVYRHYDKLSLATANQNGQSIREYYLRIFCNIALFDPARIAFDQQVCTVLAEIPLARAWFFEATGDGFPVHYTVRG